MDSDKESQLSYIFYSLLDDVNYYIDSSKAYEEILKYYTDNSNVAFDKQLIESIMKKYITSSYKNRCVVCNIDIGVDNPRQYCGKYFCPKMLEDAIDDQ
jgi:hypothetical protein